MADAVADSTQDWLLPEGFRPPTIAELERRVEEALATARASEAAVMTVGASALEAAQQARRAAELAERASAAMAGSGLAPRERQPLPVRAKGDRLKDFHARADYLAARLRELQRLPLGAEA